MNLVVREPNPNLMLVTKTLDASPSGGREMLCKLNHDALRDLYGDQFRLFELSNRPLSGLRAFVNAFQGHIDGLDAETIRAILTAVRNEQISKAFVDGSNLGVVAALIKQQFPRVEVISFFHNVEARFFWGAFTTNRTFRALGVLIANYLSERKAVRYSDKIICLSDRDSGLLKQLYGRAATHVSPMALQDKLPANHDSFPNPPDEEFALFVGGGFYANRAGIAWFVKHVVPHIQIKTCIVGRGFEDLKHELERDGKVEVVGAVDSLADWYRNAHFVIAPIFDGSGMKTKVAEALMFGKKIIGTPEAFSGYEDVVDRAGHICTSADDFVSAINIEKGTFLRAFDPVLRAIYEETYSYPSARSRLADITGSVE